MSAPSPFRFSLLRECAG